MNQSSLAALLVATFAIVAPCPAINVATVPVGNPGNPADTRFFDPYHPGGMGAVSYPFRMGTTEVTNFQYVAFLNAVAATDPYFLYNEDMATSVGGGIVRNGSPGSYTYTVRPATLNGTYTYGDKPVVFVSPSDTMRFANWLQNGQPTGTENASTTESGAYTMNGTSNPPLARNPGARWFVPNEQEWYKAAYYDPIASTYYTYPMGSNNEPDNNMPSLDTGNSGNFNKGGPTTGDWHYPLTGAGFYTQSASPYGTYDQGGNAYEWNDTPYNTVYRGVRGGLWNNVVVYLRADYWNFELINHEDDYLGFRVATVTPEPTALTLAAFGLLGLLLRPRRMATR